MVLGKKNKQQLIIVPTSTVLHTYLYVVVVKDIQDIPRGFYNRNQAQQAWQIYPICLTDSACDYIIDENLCRDKS